MVGHRADRPGAASGGYRRFAWTRADSDLREWFAGECAARGMDLDGRPGGQPVGLVGRPGCAVRRPARGRHGVASGLGARRRCVRRSARGGQRARRRRRVAGPTASVPARPIGVVNFADEEGARFGIACAGSRIITGQLDADRAAALTDADGVTWPRRCPAGGSRSISASMTRPSAGVGCFVELHVEQGRALVDTGDPLAIGTGCGRTAAGASTFPARPTTRAPPGWPTGGTR